MYMYRDVSVGIATRYGLDVPVIEYRYGREIPQLSRPALGPIQRPVQGVPGLLPGVKQLGRGVDHPPPSKAKVEETVELYLYSPAPIFMKQVLNDTTCKFIMPIINQIGH
jgi:hypothetical protein